MSESIESRSESSASLPARLAFFAAGADSQLLDDCSWSERRRIITLGWIVLAIGLLNWFAMTNALLIVFGPGSSDSLVSRVEQVLVANIVGLAWFVIVFNIFRFVVGSSKSRIFKDISVGAGYFRIPSPEGALKLGFAVLIGVSASVPICATLLHKDLQGKLSDEQLQAIRAFSVAIDKDYKERFRDVYEQWAVDREQIEALDARKRLMQSTRPMTSGAGGPVARSGTDSAASPVTIEEISARLDALISAQQARQAELDRLHAAREADIAKTRKRIESGDSLLGEIARALSHGRMVFFCVMFLSVLIHVSPIVWTMLVREGPYEWFAEIQSELLQAKYGIARDSLEIPHRDAALVFDRYLVPEKILQAEVENQKILQTKIRKTLHEKRAITGG